MFGMYLGFKAVDYFLWDQTKADKMTEEIEVDFWKKYGYPKFLKFDLQDSVCEPGTKYITYLKDTGPEKRLEEVYK